MTLRSRSRSTAGGAAWSETPRASVIYGHGLGGHAYDTWRRAPDDNSLWPLWLAMDLPGLAVYTVNDQATASNWLATAMALHALRAGALLWRKVISSDRQEGIKCAAFRDEGGGLSSDLPCAEEIAWARWPGERHYTYMNMNGRKVRSSNPGFVSWPRAGGALRHDEVDPPAYFGKESDMKAQYRQGDVFLEAVAAIPDTAKPDEGAGTVVVAHGEVTGHSHAFRSPQVCMFRETGSDGVSRTFVRVSGDAPVPLQHEEHGAIEVPPGDYEVMIQREYQPAAIRPVTD